MFKLDEKKLFPYSSTMSNALIIIPTYNEKENVEQIAQATLDVQADLNILFVDDNSPDGTGRMADAMAEKDDRIHVYHKEKKEGLGRAYIEGFKWALEHGYEYIFEMDADFSHDPKEIPNFLKEAEQSDLVLGTRYKGGIRIVNWPLRRLMLSKGASMYVKILTGLPVTDPTGGYKCFRRKVLEAIDLSKIMASGYAFQIEMTHTAWLEGFKIGEVPITFEDRRSGESKMALGIAKEAILLVLKLALRGRPKKQRPPLRQGSGGQAEDGDQNTG